MTRTITVEITGDTSKLNAALDAAEQRLAEFEQRAEAKFEGLLQRFNETVENFERH